MKLPRMPVNDKEDFMLNTARTIFFDHSHHQFWVRDLEARHGNESPDFYEGEG